MHSILEMFNGQLLLFVLILRSLRSFAGQMLSVSDFLELHYKKKYNNDSTIVLNWYLAAGFILDLKKDLGDLNYLFSIYIIPLNKRHYLSLQTLLT